MQLVAGRTDSTMKQLSPLDVQAIDLLKRKISQQKEKGLTEEDIRAQFVKSFYSLSRTKMVISNPNLPDGIKLTFWKE
ncbi:MAG: hypothetical protein V2A54_09995, partial [Bacteroidota bacterium]